MESPQRRNCHIIVTRNLTTVKNSNNHFILNEIKRCLKGEQYCDVLLSCEQESPSSFILAHRIVLASASPFLSSILHDHQESDAQIIFNAPKNILKSLVQFIYGNPLVYNFDSAEHRNFYIEIVGWLKLFQIENYSQEFSWDTNNVKINKNLIVSLPKFKINKTEQKQSVCGNPDAFYISKRKRKMEIRKNCATPEKDENCISSYSGQPVPLISNSEERLKNVIHKSNEDKSLLNNGAERHEDQTTEESQHAESNWYQNDQSSEKQIVCYFCKNGQLKMASLSEYSDHLLYHLKMINDFCLKLDSIEENKTQEIQFSNMHCPCCSEKMTTSKRKTHNDNKSDIQNHIKKCSWNIVSERQRINFKSNKNSEKDLQIQPTKNTSKLSISNNEESLSSIERKPLSTNKRKKAESEFILCSVCGRRFSFNISYNKHKCRNSSEGEFRQNAMVKVFPKNFEEENIESLVKARSDKTAQFKELSKTNTNEYHNTSNTHIKSSLKEDEILDNPSQIHAISSHITPNTASKELVNPVSQLQNKDKGTPYEYDKKISKATKYLESGSSSKCRPIIDRQYTKKDLVFEGDNPSLNYMLLPDTSNCELMDTYNNQSSNTLNSFSAASNASIESLADSASNNIGKQRLDILPRKLGYKSNFEFSSDSVMDDIAVENETFADYSHRIDRLKYGKRYLENQWKEEIFRSHHTKYVKYNEYKRKEKHQYKKRFKQNKKYENLIKSCNVILNDAIKDKTNNYNFPRANTENATQYNLHKSDDFAPRFTEQEKTIPDDVNDGKIQKLRLQRKNGQNYVLLDASKNANNDNYNTSLENRIVSDNTRDDARPSSPIFRTQVQKDFETKPNLEETKKISFSPYRCSKCGDGFGSQNVLKSHMLLEHELICSYSNLNNEN